MRGEKHTQQVRLHSKLALVNHRATWQPPCVSSTLGNAQIAAKTTSVIVASEMEPKKILGKKLKSFLSSFVSKELPRNSFRGSGGSEEQRKLFSSTS